MATVMPREQAAAAVAAATAERDGIQAKLLDLDGSFGKRMLAGAALTGESKRRWEVATADLAALWETFTAYAAVVDKAGELLAGARRSSDRELAQITTLLTGASVEVTRSVPLARRDLTESGRLRRRRGHPGPGRRADRRRRAAATAGRDRGPGRAAGRAGQAQGRGTVGPAGGRAGHHRGRGGRGGAAVRGYAAGGGGAPGQARRAARPARRLSDQGGPAGSRRGQRTHQAL